VEIKNRQKLLLIVAAAGLLLLVADSLVISPLYASWESRSKEITDMRKTLSDDRQLVKRKALLLGRWDRIQTNALPSNESLAESALLKSFYRWAQDSGVSIASTKLQWRESGEDYLTLECRADATGDMRAVTRFLYEMEKDPLAVKLESLEISSRDDGGQQLSLGLQVSGLLLGTQSP
jgi:hypothetical protein